MNGKQFFYECDEGECTVYYKKPYPVDVTQESPYIIVMEIGYTRGYYFTMEEAIAYAERMCEELNNKTK